MKIVILNGSPKGDTSTTLQYVRFIQKKFPECDFQMVRVVHDHETILNDEATFQSVLDDIRAADGVLWAFPIYTFLVHSHLKRFIEKVIGGSAQDVFQGRYAATLSTSIHFFDNTAHDYIRAISEDWGMNFVGAYSASVYDLLKKKQQQHLMIFTRDFLSAIENQTPTAKIYDPVICDRFEYAPGPTKTTVSSGNKNILILTDAEDESSNVAKMVQKLRSHLEGAPEPVNLHQVAIRSGCVGCFRCGDNGTCIFRQADDLHDLYETKLAPADIVVMAGSIVDRYLSSRWKLFYDRGFFRPVIPWLPGKQLAFIISGPLRQLATLQQILEGYADFHQANLAGMVTDECQDSETIDRLLETLATRLVTFSEGGFVKPRTFLGVGSTKIFRDETWGFLRPVFQDAYRYYRKHKMYDFPQYNLKIRAIIFIGMLFTRLPGARKRFFLKVESQLVRALQKVVDKEPVGNGSLK